jgi:indole-3-glycerol phosphate synthase
MERKKDILDNFLSAASQSISEGYYNVPATVPRAAKVSLGQKLLSQGFSLICEIKHASPAGEYSFDNIDVQKTAASFKANGADAISVVVEPKIFKGNLSNVPIAKGTGLPVLFKDFVFDPVQVEAASRIGADCMLLVAKACSRMGADIDSLVSLAHARGLEVLLECYDEDEMEMALKTDADILGINNRDLMTLKVDLGRTKRIMREAKGTDKPVISESGIKAAADVRAVRASGVRGALVGTAIWKSPDIGAKIRELKSG